MMVRGQLIREKDGVEFRSTDKLMTCTECLRPLKNSSAVYVCSSGKAIYCSCWGERLSPVCLMVKHKSHEDICARLILE